MKLQSSYAVALHASEEASFQANAFWVPLAMKLGAPISVGRVRTHRVSCAFSFDLVQKKCKMRP